ncbi:MAG: hypothetical protein U5K81_07090 [Trueperaceae bacterium]|nr:hypothetical protein [Trueperaceae bacterium]
MKLYARYGSIRPLWRASAVASSGHVGFPLPQAVRRSRRSDFGSPALWPMRKITNSAGLTGAMPMTVTTCPASITSWGLVSSSHFTKNASSGDAPARAPSRHSIVRNAPMSRVIDFHNVRSFGSNTTQRVELAMDSSTMLNRRRTFR